MSWHKPKEFVCKKCNASFKKKRQLKSHMKDSHSLFPSGLNCPNCEEEMVMDYAGEREQCPNCHWRENV